MKIKIVVISILLLLFLIFSDFLFVIDKLHFTNEEIVAGSIQSLSNILSNLMLSMTTVIVGFLAYKGVTETIASNREDKLTELKNELDSKSEWRKQLFDLASKTQINTDDIHRIMASLRFIPKNEVFALDNINKKNNKKNETSDVEEKFYNKALLVLKEEIETYKENEKSKNCEEKEAKKCFDLFIEYIFVDLIRLLDKYETTIKVEQAKKDNNDENNKGDKSIDLSISDSERVRIYAKYLLKDHWENSITNKRKLEDTRDTINKFIEILMRLNYIEYESDEFKYYKVYKRHIDQE